MTKSPNRLKTSIRLYLDPPTLATFRDYAKRDGLVLSHLFDELMRYYIDLRRSTEKEPAK